MLKIRKKEKTDCCLNCSYPLPGEYNFCPRCGQKNINNNPTFGELVTDFFQNYFSLDSKLGRSIKPFFFKPGFLTNRFNEGQRANYVNPVRLYLIISFFYFFIVGILVNQIEAEADRDEEALKAVLDEEDLLAKTDSIVQDKSDIEFNFSTGDDTDTSIEKFFNYADVDSISDEAFLDSLGIEVQGSQNLEKRVVTQLRRAMSNPELLKASIAKNLPIMMFLLLPMFALVLKLMYVRKNLLYIRHLVHSLHLHAFAFFVFGFTLLILNYLFSSFWVSLTSFLLVVFYSFISFKNVYGQSKRKTFIKLLILAFSYFFLLLVFIIFELLISFLFF